MNNLKQLGIGLLMYVQDYDGWMPCRCANNQAGYFWWGAISPYVGLKGSDGKWLNQYNDNWENCKLLRCPSEKRVYPGYFFNYAYNSNLGSNDGSLMGIFQKYQSVKNPSWCLWVGDVQTYPNKNEVGKVLGTPTYRFTWYFGLGGGETEFGALHNLGGNYLWADGHVSWLKWDQQFERYTWRAYPSYR
ncbi:MAG: hypothetical protein NC911_06575 [Candidatus Omnitrophica bacterium]|nr:hypothetical protein [Candidatus Omnitrophota bacterium]